MKMKKKGKVYPSPSLPQPSSSSSTHNLNEDDSLSVLKLLPSTILVLVSILSAEDREVLAYLITRGTTVSKKTKTKNKSSKNHKPPVFDCECFDCYTNYWFRWDSSPNRELIHQIIEAFENHHLIIGENSVSSGNNKSKRGKKKEKSSRKIGGDKEEDSEKLVESVTETSVSDRHVSDSSPGRLSEAEDKIVDGEESTVVVYPAEAEHKGLARKVLPDVLGLFNSNFWKLWNPNA